MMGKKQGMEANCKRFELDQGGQGCDEVIGGRQKLSYRRERQGNTMQPDFSQAWGRATPKNALCATHDGRMASESWTPIRMDSGS